MSKWKMLIGMEGLLEKRTIHAKMDNYSHVGTPYKVARACQERGGDAIRHAMSSCKVARTRQKRGGMVHATTPKNVVWECKKETLLVLAL